MANELFEVIPVPVIEVSLAPAYPVVEVTIQQTGPQGPQGLDGTTADTKKIDGHIADSTSPHGVVLTQDILLVTQPRVKVINVGEVSTSQTVDFSLATCYTYTATGTINMTVEHLAVGQRGSVHILAGTPAPDIMWVGIGAWIGGAPIYIPGKLTVVSLFYDGVRNVASYGIQP